MKISEAILALEAIAPPVYQESYDNAGLITGQPNWECTGILCTLDATEEVIKEAKSRGCNLVVAHHPIVFSGLKKINGKNYVERSVITAIKTDIAIYAIHTNLDNMINGVNDRIANQLGLTNRQILSPKEGQLMKLFTFVPVEHADQLRQSLFDAGAGNIGNYSETSFNSPGSGTFKGNADTHPFAGQPGKQHTEAEIRIEVVFPAYLVSALVRTLKENHPYEEVAYDIISLSNEYQSVGSGLIGELPEDLNENGFLQMLATSFGLSVVRHTPLLGKTIKKVAVCGGSGSFLIKKAISAGADIYISADIKYHEFFDADGRIVVADIGHWESEQYTTDLLIEVLQAKFPTFAVLKSGIKTNPVNYFIV